MLEPLRAECATIIENCTYLADAHYISAKRFEKRGFWLQAIPASASAVMGSLALSGVLYCYQNWIILFSTALAGFTAAISFMNPSHSYHEHKNAAAAFTVLKQDARALKDSFGPAISDEEMTQRVQRLHDRYNELSRFLIPTVDADFEKARKRIQEDRIHEPDEKK
jgi:hypothetical protein